MRFSVLGPVEVLTDSGRISLGAPRHRAFLAYLLLHPNRVVTPGCLVDALWGGAEPHSARAQIHVVVSQLRRALREHGLERALDTQPGGYRLTLAEHDLDAEIFGREVAAGHRLAERGNWAESARRLRAALDLWRGQALTDITAAYAQSVRHRLHEERLGAQELLAEAELELGQHDTVISGLRRLAEEHPSRERLACCLMLAQYRAGRPTEALQTARRVRTHLAEEHGLDPGARLTQLEKAILNADPSLALHLVPPPDVPPLAFGAGPDAGATAGRESRATAGQGAVDAGPPPGLAGPLSGGGPPGTTRTANVVPAPAQLPLDQRGFTGRDLELGRLSAMAATDGDAPPLVLVVGMAGVGKTALAVRWSHRQRDRFPDGQLYVDLRGFDPVQPPVAPLEALRRFLRAFGVEPAAIPDDVDDAAALFRSRLSGRRVLVVLDNAHDSDQVRPLLPGSPGCTVLMTSRRQLRSLVAREGVRLLPLDPLTPDEAYDMLRTILAERAPDGAGPTVRELARRCSYLPLALRLAAAQIACDEHLSVADYAARLALDDPLSFLDGQGEVDGSISVTFGLSYRALGPMARRLFRLLSLLPGQDFGLPAAAALLRVTSAEVRRPLAELRAAHLVTEHRPGRYLMHDLLRSYAATTCTADEPVADREVALRRLVDFYAQTVFDAYPLLQPRRMENARDRAHPPVEPLIFTDRAAALDWHEQEREHLVGLVRIAAEHGWYRCAWELVADLMAYLSIRRRWSEWLTVLRIGRRCAERDGNMVGLAQMENGLGIVHKQTGRYATARTHYGQALAFAEAAGHGRMVAAFRVNLGGLCITEGDFEAGVRHLRSGLANPDYAQQPQYACAGYINLGCVLIDLDRYPEATEALQTALDLSLQVDDVLHVCLVHHNFAEIALRRGDRRTALHHASRQLELAQEIGDPLRTATARDMFASALGPDDLPAARNQWRVAYQIYRELGHPVAEIVADWLTTLDGFHDADALAAADEERRRRTRRLL